MALKYRNGLVGVFVAWSMLAAGLQMRLSVHRSARNTRQVARWFADSRDATRLRDVMRGASVQLSQGEAIGFAAKDSASAASRQLWLWAAFFLPERDVIPLAESQVTPTYAVFFDGTAPSDGTWRVRTSILGSEFAERAENKQ